MFSPRVVVVVDGGGLGVVLLLTCPQSQFSGGSEHFLKMRYPGLMLWRHKYQISNNKTGKA